MYQKRYPKNMNQNNIFFIDIETSGLYDPLLHGYPQILSFGACAHDFEQFKVPIIRPNKIEYTIEPEAQKIHGITREMIESCQDKKTFKCCWKEFIKWTDQYDNEEIFLVAYNGLKFDFLIIMHTLFGSRGNTEKSIYFVDTYFDLRQAYPDFQASKDKIMQAMQIHCGLALQHSTARDSRALKKIFDQLVFMIPFHFIEFERFYDLKLQGQKFFYRYLPIAMQKIFLFDSNCCYNQLPYGSFQKENKKIKISIDHMICTVCKKYSYDRQQIMINQKDKLSMIEVIESLFRKKEEDKILEKKVKLEQ